MNFKCFKFLPWALLPVVLVSCKKKEVTPEQIEMNTAYYSSRVCPMRINDNMTMDSVVFHADDPENYYYYYTVSGIMDNDYELPILIDGQRSIYLTNLRTATEMQPVMELGATVNHVFRSKSTGKVIYDLVFVSEEYNGDYISNAPAPPETKAQRRRRLKKERRQKKRNANQQ